MAFCSECGREVPQDREISEERARSPGIPAGPQTSLNEAECITYLLREIPVWRERGWICDHCSGLLVREYAGRQASLLQSSPSVAAAADSSAPLTVSSAVPPDAAAQEGAVTDASLEPEPRGPVLAEFMEAHSMKLLALLAALFIFVGMRQILVWKWAGGLALALIPLLPMSLTAIFYYFGVRSRDERTFGGYAYCVVAIVLTAFTVFSVSEYWLGGALSRSWTLLLGIAASTCLAAWTLRKTGDAAFLHPLLGGTAVTLNAGLQIVRPSSWLAPEPMLLYGSAFLALAFFYLHTARRMGNARDEDSLPRRTVGPLLLWMHLCAGAVLARGLLLYGAGAGSEVEAGGLLALAALLYGLFAQWFADAGMVYAACGVASLSAVLLLAGTGRVGWYPGGLAALALCGAALGMARLNRPRPEPSPPGTASERAVAYTRIAWIMSGLAGSALPGRLLASLAGLAAPPASSDWAAGALLAALCSALYTGLAYLLRKPDLLYAAAGAAAFAMTVAAHRLAPEAFLLAPHTLAHDLFPFAAAALVIGLWTSRRSGGNAGNADQSKIENRKSKIQDAALPFLLSASVTAGFGLLLAVGQGLVEGTSPGVWSALGAYGLLSLAGTVALRTEGWGALRSFCASCLVADTAACAGFLAAAHSPAAPWTPLLAAGMALVLLAWAWYVLAEGVRPSAAGLADCLGIGAGVTAVFGAALATSGVDGAAGRMTLAFAGALALLVTMGMRRGSGIPVCMSFAIVILCPLRLASAAFDPHGTGTPAVLAAVLFALVAAALYGLAAWRMNKPDIIWLTAASLGIAGGGGILFGAPQPSLARIIAETAGFGMALGALGLGVTAAWGRRRLLTYAAGLLGVVAYMRLVTLFFAIERPWLGMALLPALIVLVAASHLRTGGDDTVFHRPCQRVALAVAYIALPLLAAATITTGPQVYLPLAVTLFSYALVFGIATQAGAELDHPLGVLSTAALVGGWFFGLQVPRGDPYSRAADLLLVIVTGICAVLYGRVAWRLERQPPGYGAALAGCCAWIGLIARAVSMPDVFWSLALLPFLLGLYAVGDALRGVRADSLGAPLRRTAAGAAGPAVAWAMASGLERGLTAAAWVVTGTLSAYGAALAAGALRHRTAFWVAAGASVFTLAFGYRLAASASAPPDWAWRFALAAALWILAARLLERRAESQALAVPLYALATLVAGVAGAVALAFLSSPGQELHGLAAFALAGSAEAALFLAGRGALHAHGAFAGYLPAYFLLLRHVGRLDSAFADIYLLPVGLYALALAHLAARKGQPVWAWGLRWAGLLTLLAPTFAAFYTNYTQGGTPVHALLLLLQCVAAVGCGIAGRIRAFVQAGTLFALGFVAASSFSVVEIWTGLFSVVLGIALLAGVFYVSVHQKALRSWMSRVGDEWRQWR
jgi:hypothetical protein